MSFQSNAGAGQHKMSPENYQAVASYTMSKLNHTAQDGQGPLLKEFTYVDYPVDCSAYYNTQGAQRIPYSVFHTLGVGIVHHGEKAKQPGRAIRATDEVVNQHYWKNAPYRRNAAQRQARLQEMQQQQRQQIAS